MRRMIIVALLCALSYAQTDRCEDDPFGTLAQNAMTCATLLNLAVCGDMLGNLDTKELCPKSCNLCTTQDMHEQVDSLPNLPNQQACGEGYTVCTEAMQGYGVNCALGSCTKRIQPNQPDEAPETVCEDGYVLCDRKLQGFGVNCALGSCTEGLDNSFANQHDSSSHGSSSSYSPNGYPSAPASGGSYSNDSPGYPSAPASGGLNPAYDCQEGRGQYGRGNKAKHVSSQQACQSQCNMDISCMGFDFNTPHKGNSMCRLYGFNTPRYGSSGKSHWTYCSKSKSQAMKLQKILPAAGSERNVQTIVASTALSFIFGVFAALFVFVILNNITRTKSKSSPHLLEHQVPI